MVKFYPHGVVVWVRKLRTFVFCVVGAKWLIINGLWGDEGGFLRTFCAVFLPGVFFCFHWLGGGFVGVRGIANLGYGVDR